MEIGQAIPDFTAQSSAGSISPQQLLGKRWVLYFYPKDNTPGCTTEGIDFNALYDEFLSHNCALIGVSRDSLKSHDKFICKHAFRFPLISDEDETVCNIFDVIKPKKLYGKEYIGIERSTFIIDEQGKLQHEFRKVKVKGHAEAVLSLIKKNRELRYSHN